MTKNILLSLKISPALVRWALLTVVMLIAMQLPGFAAESTLQITGEVVYINMEGGFYGIIGDDGKKYQPTNLPRDLRKSGLPVKFSAVARENYFTTIMWGTIIEIKTARKLTPPLSPAERSAIHVMLQRMEAFNTKDLMKLQQIDMVAQRLLPEQFASWVGNYHNFTLHYLDISCSDSLTIRGSCLYSRYGASGTDRELAYMNFTLDRTKEGWKLVQSSSEPCSYTVAEVTEAAKAKYGTDDVAKLWQ